MAILSSHVAIPVGERLGSGMLSTAAAMNWPQHPLLLLIISRLSMEMRVVSFD